MGVCCAFMSMCEHVCTYKCVCNDKHTVLIKLTAKGCTSQALLHGQSTHKNTANKCTYSALYVNMVNTIIIMHDSLGVY